MLPKYGAFQQTSRENNHLPAGFDDSRCHKLNVELRLLIDARCVPMVPRAGLEPARSFDQRILSPLRLPIPPPGRDLEKMEARVGIEPAYTELQSAA